MGVEMFVRFEVVRDGPINPSPLVPIGLVILDQLFLLAVKSARGLLLFQFLEVGVDLLLQLVLHRNHFTFDLGFNVRHVKPLPAAFRIENRVG